MPFSLNEKHTFVSDIIENQRQSLLCMDGTWLVVFAALYLFDGVDGLTYRRVSRPALLEVELRLFLHC